MLRLECPTTGNWLRFHFRLRDGLALVWPRPWAMLSTIRLSGVQDQDGDEVNRSRRLGRKR
jgi:hypothetical protein